MSKKIIVRVHENSLNEIKKILMVHSRTYEKMEIIPNVETEIFTESDGVQSYRNINSFRIYFNDTSHITYYLKAESNNENFTINDYSVDNDYETDEQYITQWIYSYKDVDLVDFIEMSIILTSDDEKEIPYTVPFNIIYKMTENEVTTFTSEYLTVHPINDESETLDKYIQSFILYPFIIDDSIFNEIYTNIRLGNNSLETTSRRSLQDNFTIELGQIIIPKINNVLLPTANIELLLPNLDIINLDPNFWNNSTCTIKIVLDFYTGECTIFLYKNNDEIATYFEKQHIGRNIPIKSKKEVTNSLGAFQGVNNNISKAFIRIELDVIDNNKEKNLTLRTDGINEYIGFLTVDDLKLVTVADEGEQNEILNILQNGIYKK